MSGEYALGDRVLVEAIVVGGLDSDGDYAVGAWSSADDREEDPAWIYVRAADVHPAPSDPTPLDAPPGYITGYNAGVIEGRRLAAAAHPLPAARTCQECESEDLTWTLQASLTESGQVVDGRLRLNDVRAILVLGCETCSATVQVSTDVDPRTGEAQP